MIILLVYNNNYVEKIECIQFSFLYININEVILKKNKS